MENIESLFKLSSLIISLYNDFVSNDIYNTDSRRREAMLKQIKTLVFKEYNLLRLLPSSEIEKYYSGEYELDEEYQSIVFDRVNAKMMNLTDDYDGYIINGFELEMADVPAFMHLSIFDATMSMLELEAYTRIYNRIMGVNATCLQDEKFVLRLKEKLGLCTLESFYLMSTSEIIALSYGADIRKMPKIDKKTISEKLKKVNEDSKNNDFEDTIDSFAKSALMRLSLVDRLENKPDTVFNYLISYIRLEVALDTYLSSDRLLLLLNHCDLVASKTNQASVGMAKELIKRKINSEKN